MDELPLLTATRRPRIDVVTVCKNAAPLIERTLASVAAQSVPPNRYVIVDGASADGTTEIVNCYSTHVSYFVSEPDRGIGHAMNKGLAQCTGDYVLFLHAGDYFLTPSALDQATAALAGCPTDILACPVMSETSTRKYFFRVRGFNRWMLLKTGVPHQGAFTARSLFERVGGFDETLRVAMDYDFFLRCYRSRATLLRYPQALTAMVGGGISWRRDWPSIQARLNEERAIHLRSTTSSICILAYHAYWLIYPLYKRAGAEKKTY